MISHLSEAATTVTLPCVQKASNYAKCKQPDIGEENHGFMINKCMRICPSTGPVFYHFTKQEYRWRLA